MAKNNVREKGKTRCKLSNIIFEKPNGCDPLLDISTFPTLIQLKQSLGGSQNCVTIVGKWMFDSNIPFAPSLNRDKMDHFCTNYNETKGINFYKVVLKDVRFFQQRYINI